MGDLPPLQVPSCSCELTLWLGILIGAVGAAFVAAMIAWAVLRR